MPASSASRISYLDTLIGRLTGQAINKCSVVLGSIQPDYVGFLYSLLPEVNGAEPQVIENVTYLKFGTIRALFYSATSQWNIRNETTKTNSCRISDCISVRR